MLRVEWLIVNKAYLNDGVNKGITFDHDTNSEVCFNDHDVEVLYIMSGGLF